MLHRGHHRWLHHQRAVELSIHFRHPRPVRHHIYHHIPPTYHILKVLYSLVAIICTKYSHQQKQFFTNIGTIMIYAIGGTIMAVAISCALIYALGQVGALYVCVI